MVDVRAICLAALTPWEATGPIPAPVRHELVAVLDEPFTATGHHADTTMDTFAANLAALVERRQPLIAPAWAPKGAS